MRLLSLIALCLYCVPMLDAEVANMSGKWKLNVKRSEWGKKTAPDTVVLTIVHHDPHFKYSGEAQAPEDAPSKFAFDGAIDGKEYTMKDAEGDRRIRFTRKSDNVVESTQWRHDGKEDQHVTMLLSADGRTLTRRIRTKSPDGQTVEWTEVYEKQQ